MSTICENIGGSLDFKLVKSRKLVDMEVKVKEQHFVEIMKITIARISLYLTKSHWFFSKTPI